MTEFKAGSHFVLKDRFSINQLFRIFSIGRNIVGTKVYQVLDGGGWPEYCVRHATPEEIAAGHRIDKPSNPRELETLDKPENHISPLCKSKDV